MDSSSLSVDMDIGLTDLESAIQKGLDDKKAVLFFDGTGNLSVFFSYKARLYELNKDLLSKTMGKKTEADVNENFRKNVVNAMKQGDHLGIFVDNAIPNFNELFTDKTFVTSGVFDMKAMEEEKNYMPMVRDEDKTDNLGNHIGVYVKNEKWGISIVTTQKIADVDVDELKKFIPLDKFLIVKIH